MEKKPQNLPSTYMERKYHENQMFSAKNDKKCCAEYICTHILDFSQRGLQKTWSEYEQRWAVFIRLL